MVDAEPPTFFSWQIDTLEVEGPGYLCFVDEGNAGLLDFATKVKARQGYVVARSAGWEEGRADKKVNVRVTFTQRQILIVFLYF